MDKWGYREVEGEKLSEYQTWDYISLSDFRSRSCWTPITYAYLWLLAIIAVAAYASDIFTAVTLLAYDEWSSQIQPTIPLYISKWIFAGCILFSILLLIYEWIRAARVLRRGSVADNYLDPLAATVQCLRVNAKGQGWRRFLVFKALTKSKKGADYIALFNYFQFKQAVRIVIAEGPRQVINGMALASVMNASLLPKERGGGDIGSNIEQFWTNVQVLAETKRVLAVVMFTMLFSLVVWAVAACCLLAACIAHITFLWHYIPTSDGSLSNYCKRKVDRRLGRLVTVKAKKAIERIEAKHKKAEMRAEKEGKPLPEPPMILRKPTLPEVPGSPSTIVTAFGDNLTRKPSVATTSSSTLPPWSAGPSAAGTNSELARHPTLPTIGENSPRPDGPYRTDTQSSGASKESYDSDTPLAKTPADMGRTTPSAPPPNHIQPPHSMIAPVPPPQRSFSRPIRPPYPATQYAESTYEPQAQLQPTLPPPPAQPPPVFSRAPAPPPQQTQYRAYSPFAGTQPRFTPPAQTRGPPPRPGHTRDPSSGNEVPIIRNPVPPQPRRMMTNPYDFASGGVGGWGPGNGGPPGQNRMPPPPQRFGATPHPARGPRPNPPRDAHWP